LQWSEELTSWHVTGPHQGSTSFAETCRQALIGGLGANGTRYIDGVGGIGGLNNPETVSFTALGGEDVIGVVALYFHSRNGAEIRVISVVGNKQRAGVGKELMVHAEQYAAKHGVQSIEVKTDSHLPKPMNFYPKCGYVEIAREQTCSPHPIKSTEFLNGCLPHKCVLFAKHL
jgi:GNAT superfamily N-acetyltransferase